MHKIKKIIKGFFLRYKYGNKEMDASRAILVKMKEVKFNRYLYPFVKMLHSQGYFAVLDINLAETAHLTTDPYQNNIFKEGLLFRAKSNTTFLKKISLDPDYFTAIYNPQISNKQIIPISKHPLTYVKDLDFLALKNDRKQAVFFAGTTVNEGHSKKQIFEGVINRVDVLDRIKKGRLAVNPLNMEEYKTAKSTIAPGSVIICERNNVSFPQEELFAEMADFSFYLNLPGRGMPLCHNLTEAMYLGCIPILQDVYSVVMPEPLMHLKNALIYKDLDHLESLLNDIATMDVKKIHEMKTNVLDYYSYNLSEKALVNRVVKSDATAFYLQAEGLSIARYKESLMAK